MFKPLRGYYFMTEGLILLLNVLSILLYSNFNPLIPIISYHLKFL